MALKATVFKADVTVADLDRDHYHTYSLTLARHPSETDLRMMVRLLAFAYHAHERLQFTKGLCADDEPELWRKDLTDAIELWIELGQPDEKRLRKACQRSQQVVVYSYSDRHMGPWWESVKNKVRGFRHLGVRHLDDAVTQALPAFVKRHMVLQVHIEDGQCWLSDDEGRHLEVSAEWLKAFD